MEVKDCLAEVKKYSWLKLGTALEEDAVALLIKGYIDTHKWLINEAIPFVVTFEQAAFSWYENVYQPIIKSLEKSGLGAIHHAMGHNLLHSLKSVSDKHFLMNLGAKAYTSYDEICQLLLKDIKGFHFTKFMHWLFRK